MKSATLLLYVAFMFDAANTLPNYSPTRFLCRVIIIKKARFLLYINTYLPTYFSSKKLRYLIFQKCFSSSVFHPFFADR